MKTIELNDGLETIVDDDDFALVSKHKWYAASTPYNTYAINGSGEYLHRVILGIASGKEADHIDGDGLNNRRSNLRSCTHAQNLANQRTQTRSKHSQFKGVTLNRRTGHWLAQIKVHQRRITLGTFLREVDAAAMYNLAADHYFGAFARLNKLPREYHPEGVQDRRLIGTIPPRKWPPN